MDAGDHGAELARLERRPPGELGAGETGGKAEVVLDASARARLTARGEALDHQRAEALRGGVDRCGQARPGRRRARRRRSSGRRPALAAPARRRPRSTVARRMTSSERTRTGHSASPMPKSLEQDPALVVGGEVVPGEGNQVALQQLPDGERLPDQREPISFCWPRPRPMQPIAARRPSFAGGGRRARRERSRPPGARPPAGARSARSVRLRTRRRASARR